MDYLHKNTKKNQVAIVDENHPQGKRAILNDEILQSKQGMSLVAVQLETGRPRQIRVQLAGMGHPVYGNQKYGGKLKQVGQQMALWLLC